MKTRVPLIIPAFNNPFYIKNFYFQIALLDCFEVYIFDNGSSYEPLLEFYDEIKGEVEIVKFDVNLGPRIFFLSDHIYQRLPQYFCVSDPDLQLNPELPSSFLCDLIDLTDRCEVGKAGFALDISERELMTPKKFRHASGWKHVWESEAEHWQHQVSGDPIGEPLYLADLDTTFALYNKRFFNRSSPFDAIRVGGRYTAKHLPWYLTCDVPAVEREVYANTALYSYYSSENVPLQLRDLFARQDAATVSP